MARDTFSTGESGHRFNHRWLRPGFRQRAVWLLAALLLAQAAVAAQNVYRWKDDNGEVHYTKALPPDAGNRPYDVLSPSGMLIEHVDPSVKPEPDPKQAAAGKRKGPVPLYSEEEKRRIGDRLLLLKYASEEEIMEAMKLEIDQLKYDQHLIDSSTRSVVQSLTGQIRSAANRQRAGVEAMPEQLHEIRKLQHRLRNNDQARLKLDERVEKIRANFLADLERYRLLVSDPSASG